jgi:pimeloyl-ACP methyl ester carboxylesterase
MKNKFVKIEEDKIHYLECGSGNTIILLPSFGLTSRSYNQFGNFLSSNYHVIIPDLFKGQSINKKIASSFEDYSELLNSFIDKLKINNIYLIGISYSGMEAFKFVQKHPRKIKKLLLISTTIVPFQMSKFRFFCSYTMLFINNLFSLKGIQTNLLWFVDGINNIFRHPKQIIKDINIVTNKYDLKTKKIKVPSKLIFAKKDEFIPFSTLKKMNGIENLETEIINDYHAWFFIKKMKLINKVKEFFNE